MQKQYTRIKQYELEIFELKRKGVTNREIAEKFGFKDKYVVKQLVARYNRNQRKTEAGIALNRKGRPPKDYTVTEQDKVADLRYKINRKNSRIKQLEMENELLRNFLKETGRK